MLHVTIERDGKPPETRDLAGPTLVVGRDEGLELKLQHEDGASRRHCQISAEGGALHVEDLGSSNGTKVNGKKIDRRVALKPGDVVGVGKVRLRVTIEAGAPAKQSAVKVAAVAAAPAKQSAVKVAAVAEAPVRKPVEAARKPVEAAAATRRPAAEAPKASAAPAARVIVKSGADVEAEAEPEPAPVARDPAQPRDPAVHDENEACRGELDPLARRWRELGRPAAGLLFGAQLARGLRWMQSDRKLRPRPSEQHREFILASRRDRYERVARMSLWTGGVALTLIAGNLTAHAVHVDVVLPVGADGRPGGDAQLCSKDPEVLRRSNELAKLATAQTDAERALLVATRALAAAEGPCARHGQAEAVLRAQLTRQRSHVLAHQAVGFRDLDVARDDGLIVTVDTSGAVTLRMASGSGSPFTLPVGAGKATLAALSPADSVLAVGTATGSLELWNVAQPGKPVLFKQLSEHRDEITALAFSDDGRWLATGDRRGSMRTWDMRGSDAGTVLGQFSEHRSPVTRLLFRNGGQRLYSLGGQAFAWDLVEGRRKVKPLRLATVGDTTAIAVDSVGQEVFTADQFGEVLRWKIRSLASASSEQVVKLEPEAPIVALAFLAKDRALLTLGQDKQLLVTEVDKKMREDSLPMSIGLQGLGSEPLQLVVDPTGRRAAVAAKDHKIYVWNLAKRLSFAQPVAVLDENREAVADLVTTRDSNWLLSAGADGTLRRWNLQNTEAGAGSYAVTDHEGPISELALSADGNRLLSGGQDKKLRVWRIDPTGEPRLQFAPELEAPIKALALSSDGRWGAVGVDRQIKIFDLSAAGGGRDSVPLERAHHSEAVNQILFSADRGWMVSADDAGVVNAWRLRSDGPEETPARSEATATLLTALALAPNGSLVAAGGLDKVVRAWPLAGGGAVQQVAPHDGAVLSLAFSPNSEYLISGGEDANALLRRNVEGRLEADSEHTLFAHQRRIQGLAFSPDQRWLATGSDDGLISVWSLAERKTKKKDLSGHEGPIVALAFDATSEVLVSASSDATLRLWRVDDLDIGGDVASIALTGHSGAITAMRLDPTGRFVVSGGEDGAVHVWPLQHELLLRLACRVVGRDLGDEEWSELFPGEAFVPVCERR